jgi:hypothetical protein
VLGLVLIGLVLVLALSLLRRRTRVTLFGAGRGAAPSALPAAATVRPEPAVPATRRPAPAALPVAGPAMTAAAAPVPEPVRPAAAAVSAGREAPRPDERAAAPSTVHPHGLVLETEIADVAGDAAVTVRLVGSRAAQAAPAWQWLDPDAPSPGPTYVALGVGRQGALCIDVSQAPDVLTVTGDPAAGQRLAVSLAEQLIRNQVPVTVAGSALGRRVPGAHMVRSLADAEQATDEPAAPQVVFAAPGPEDQAIVRRLTGRSAPRTVLVLVSDARPGRWSIRVAPTGDG